MKTDDATGEQFYDGAEYGAVYFVWPPELYIWYHKTHVLPNETKTVEKVLNDYKEDYNRRYLRQYGADVDDTTIYDTLTAVDLATDGRKNLRKLDTYSIGITARILLHIIKDKLAQDIRRDEFNSYNDIFIRASEFNPDKRLDIDELINQLNLFNAAGASFAGVSAAAAGVSAAAVGGRRKASGSKEAKRKSKTAKCPQPSADRVKDSKGRNHIVYVGPKGGRYIKSKGKFVRL